MIVETWTVSDYHGGAVPCEINWSMGERVGAQAGSEVGDVPAGGTICCEKSASSTIAASPKVEPMLTGFWAVGLDAAKGPSPLAGDIGD